jgi:hypothetical protein
LISRTVFKIPTIKEHTTVHPTVIPA